MAMEISPILMDASISRGQTIDRGSIQPVKTELPRNETAPVVFSDADMRSALLDLEQVSLAFNRRLQFSINQKLDQVVVKVIDLETDTVIKEIPPRELQIVHERIRDAIGLLLDEQI